MIRYLLSFVKVGGQKSTQVFSRTSLRVVIFSLYISLLGQGFYIKNTRIRHSILHSFNYFSTFYFCLDAHYPAPLLPSCRHWTCVSVTDESLFVPIESFPVVLNSSQME